MRDFQRVRVGGIPFAVADLDQAVAWLLAASINRTEGMGVRLANAYSVAVANSDEAYGRLLSGDGVNFADGMPVARYIQFRLLGTRVHARRVRGPSLFLRALRDGQSLGVRHQFIGSTPDVLEKLVENVHRRFPQAIVVDTFAPPFGPVDDPFVDSLCDRVEAADANIVWFALGTPKQDFAAAMVAAKSGSLAVGIGAAFEFVAGTVPEAPLWIQKSGFEWFYRLRAEPKRLWKRYLFGNAAFMKSLVRPSRELIRISHE